MDILIKEYTEYNEETILKLYESVGWSNYVSNPAMLKRAYEHSLKILAAYKEDTVIGIIRVVGDGSSIIYIQDIVIHPEYQRQGIGTKLLQTMLEIYKDVYQKVLLTEHTEKTIQFYRSVGFTMDTDMECRAFMKIF